MVGWALYLSQIGIIGWKSETLEPYNSWAIFATENLNAWVAQDNFTIPESLFWSTTDGYVHRSRTVWRQKKSSRCLQPRPVIKIGLCGSRIWQNKLNNSGKDIMLSGFGL